MAQIQGWFSLLFVFVIKQLGFEPIVSNIKMAAENDGDMGCNYCSDP